MEKIVTRAKGGELERQVHINDIKVPDLWHIAMWLMDNHMLIHKDMVLECWYLCHDLKRHIQEGGNEK